jgi:hypothetical protein
MAPAARRPNRAAANPTGIAIHAREPGKGNQMLHATAIATEIKTVHHRPTKAFRPSRTQATADSPTVRIAEYVSPSDLGKKKLVKAAIQPRAARATITTFDGIRTSASKPELDPPSSIFSLRRKEVNRLRDRCSCPNPDPCQ